MLDHPAFATSLRLAQFAKAGSWETAWSFSRAKLPSQAAVREYLAGASEVAFEVFFGDAFFGARFDGSAPEVEARSLTCLAALDGASDGASFFAGLSRDEAFTGLGRNIDFTEIGAVDAWRSVGAFRAAAPREALRHFEDLWSSLAASAVAHDGTHKKAVEFACRHPLPHWFALPVSAPLPPYDLDRSRLREACEFAARAGLDEH